jgi:Rrf2 family protein
MFNLSVKVEYGILGVLALCRHEGPIPLSVRTIAEREDLSLGFLEQAMGRLKEAGLIESLRGQQGGYRLAMAPKEIKLSDVIFAIEGGKRQKALGKGASPSLKQKMMNEIINGVETVLTHHLEEINLDHLSRRAKVLEETEALMFHI